MVDEWSGGRMKALRKRARLTQKAAMEMSGVHYNTIVYLERGHHRPQNGTLQKLLNLYATRWQIELNLRYLKTQMNLNQIDCKSADMAEKEWMAGLLAYNLVRAVMLSAALQKGTQPSRLSFSATRRWLVQWLVASSTGTKIVSSWESLLNRVAQIRQPNRSQPRPSEPRAKRHKRETFPPLRGCRLVARKNLKTFTSKS